MTPPTLEEIAKEEGLPLRAVQFVHDLHHDPRMCVDAIAELAERMPQSVVSDVADKGLLVPQGGPPRGKLQQPGDVIRHLATSQSWLTLLNVEDDPDYEDLMDTHLDRLERGMRAHNERMHERAAFIILGSPNSVTPVHFDIEHSLLVQASGRKRVTVGRWESDAAKRHEIERYFDGSHGRMESVPPALAEFELEPGLGLYIPNNVPHWVHYQDEASFSITFTFFTTTSLRHCRIEDLNSHLRRRFHLRPGPPGTSAVSDAVKTAAIGIVRRGRKLRSGMSPAQRHRDGSR